jgi:hypothetical protein
MDKRRYKGGAGLRAEGFGMVMENGGKWWFLVRYVAE